MPDQRSFWYRWRRLSATDRRELVALTLLLPLADLSLRCVGMQRTRRCLSRWTRNIDSQPCSATALSRAQRLAELAAIAGRRGIYANSCLRQALVVQTLLLRRGLPAELKVGTRKLADGRLDAHAWVELDGHALAQGDLPHTAFSRLEGTPR